MTVEYLSRSVVCKCGKKIDEKLGFTKYDSAGNVIELLCQECGESKQNTFGQLDIGLPFKYRERLLMKIEEQVIVARGENVASNAIEIFGKERGAPWYFEDEDIVEL